MYVVQSFSSGAVVQLTAEPLILSAALEAEVERLWQREQQRRGKKFFNGKIMSATTLSTTRIEGRMVEYRYLIAQRASPALFSELSIRPVAVSGLFACQEGIVLGRRATSLLQDAGSWELVPSGGLDVSNLTASNIIDYRAQILTELEEEIGIPPTAVTSLNPFCVVEDLATHVIDIGIRLTSALTFAEVVALAHTIATPEYEELQVIPLTEVKEFMQRKTTQCVKVSAKLIEYFSQEA